MGEYLGFTGLFFENLFKEFTTVGEEPEAIERVTKELRSGVKHLSAQFINEGHFLQKFRAELLARAIQAVLERNKTAQKS